MVNLTFFLQRTLLLLGVAFSLAACSIGSRVTTTQDVSESADTPYQNILVIALFSQFDTRKRLEKEVVRELSDRGIDAVASTSLMTTKTPVTRQNFLAMVEELDSDAVLVTHLVDVKSKVAMKETSSPEATYNVRPTYYFNVWEVELTEYAEPKGIEVRSSLVLATQLYSVQAQDVVWAIESKSKIVQQATAGRNYMIIVEEAEAIAKHLSSDGLIAQ